MEVKWTVKCLKVFNNSAVSTVMPDGREAIVLGNGIGFNRRPGDPVPEERIEKVYYIQDEMQTKFLQMLQDVRPDVMEAAEEIIATAEQAGFILSNQATISLIDHISFAIERQQENISLPNLLLGETRLLYQKEYELGLQALGIIKTRCGVSLPEDEAGYIALHLITISADRAGTYDTLKFVKGAGEIIKEIYGVSLDPQSLDAMRLMTHLKFLAQRIFQHTAWEDDDDMDEMYEYLLSRSPKNQAALDRLDQYIKKNFGYTLNKQEKFYLLVHLTKILTNPQ